MTKHPEAEEKPSEDKTEDGSAPPSKAALLRAKLKLVGSYAMRGFAPVMSVVALVIAVLGFTGNRSGQVQFDKVAAGMDNVNASLATSKTRLEKLEASMVQEQTAQQDERRKRDTQVTEIIQGVTRLQEKMKVFPTLEEVLYLPASAAVAAPPAVAPASAAPSAVAPAVAAKSAVAAAAPAVKEKKPSQAQIIKDQIDRFNK